MATYAAPSSSVKAAIDAEKLENGKNKNPLFFSTSNESLTLLHISFKENPSESLGAKLVNCGAKAASSPSSASSGDSKNAADAELQHMFLPGYAVIGKLLGGDDSIARKADVHIGDVVIAVNGMGFRRFAPDYKHDDGVTVVSYPHKPTTNGDATTKEEDLHLDHRVVPATTGYDDLLARIKSIKAASGDGGGEPLLLTLERYGWDERPNSWGRFLAARDYSVPNAMQMLQEHELWKAKTFPISLPSEGLQLILKEKAVSEIDIDEKILTDPSHAQPPTVYVNYGKLLALQSSGKVTADDVVSAFLIFNERMLEKAPDPRKAKTCQFIDLSDVSISSGFRVETLKKIYHVFEPNYPETLSKMVMYPVPALMASTARTMLSFVNETTQKKFVISNNLLEVCKELGGWDPREVEECGGMSEFMHKHEKIGSSLLFN